MKYNVFGKKGKYIYQKYIYAIALDARQRTSCFICYTIKCNFYNALLFTIDSHHYDNCLIDSPYLMILE